MTPTLGILLDGGEKEFLRTVISAMSRFDNPLYVELGVAYGQTLRGVWSAVQGIPDSRVLGIELPEWLSWNSIETLFSTVPEFAVNDPSFRATVLKGRSVEVLSALTSPPPISCAFIDACHGKDCVTADFLALDRLCHPGSTVIFHDACEKSQGGDTQPHCNQPIGVRHALHDLGLLPWQGVFPSPRPDWKFTGFLPTANHCAVFEKLTR